MLDETSRDSGAEVRIERRSAALWVTLARPHAFNALTPASIALIGAALDHIEADATLRACVITGEGRGFCAGADLKAVRANGHMEDADAATARFLRDVGRVFDRLEALCVPTLALVNGVALAGGLELLLCCDIVVAADTATLGDGHATYGQIPGGGGTLRLPRRVGASRAKYLMFTAASLQAAQAQIWGLVDEVVPAGELDTRASALVERMARHSPLVLARMKELVNMADQAPPQVALRAELRESVLHMASHDRNEGLAAFAEKREPHYLGR